MPGLDGNRHLFHRDVAKICFEDPFHRFANVLVRATDKYYTDPREGYRATESREFYRGNVAKRNQGNFTVLMDTSLQGVSEQGGTV